MSRPRSTIQSGAGLVVYSIYYEVQGRFDRSMYANNAGQSLCLKWRRRQAAKACGRG